MKVNREQGMLFDPLLLLQYTNTTTTVIPRYLVAYTVLTATNNQISARVYKLTIYGARGVPSVLPSSFRKSLDGRW